MTTRRQLLTAGAAATGVVLAGCSGGESTPERTLRIVLNNQSGRAQTVTITVTDAEDAVVEEYADETIQDGVSTPFESSDYEDGSYSIAVDGDDWASGGVYHPESCPRSTFTTLLEAGEAEPAVTAMVSCDE